ncbi:unnamed protein product [Rotaria sordida]|uniref:Uncharacterized protein n=1 Tax=Rotaria sordida TaxID=392033 RepID=A0A820GJI1_9BILA|nr:unnamed protein product [Rotaria sordida]
MLNEWTKNMINRIETIYKSKLQRLRDEFERQQAARRRYHMEQNKIENDNENEKIDLTNINFTNINFTLINSSFIDAEYTLMTSSLETILKHDGRTFKLFDKNLRPLVALDLTNSMCQRLWIFQPGSNANLITSIKRRGCLSLTTNTKDLFMLDIDGTIEQ